MKFKRVPVEWTDEIAEAMAEAYRDNSDKESIKNWLHLRPMYEAALSAAPTPPDCQECNGEYAVDSGGTHPWGEAALIPCPKCSPTPPEVEPIAEIVAEDMGNPFNAARIRAHFYKEIPPIGTKLYAAPTPPEVDALKEELKSWITTSAERTMQKAALLDELVTLKVENERLRKACSKAATWLAGNSIDDTAHKSWRKDAKFLFDELRAAMTPNTKGE